MRGTQFPDEASQVAAEYHLGEPIWVFQTLDKRQHLQRWGGISVIFTVFALLDVGFGMDAEHIMAYGFVLLFLLGIFALVVFPPVVRTSTTVYLCAEGVAVVHASSWQAVRWEEVERVQVGNMRTPCVIGLKDPSRPALTVSNYVIGIQALSEEITRQIEQARRPHHPAEAEESKEGVPHELAPQPLSLTLSPEPVSPMPTTSQLVTEPSNGTGEQPLIISCDRGKMALGLAVCIAFTAMCVWGIEQEQEWWWQGIALMVGGLVLLLVSPQYLYALFQPTALVVNEEGIQRRTVFGTVFVAWQEIAAISWVPVPWGSSSLLQVSLSEIGWEAFLLRHPRLQRPSSWRKKRIGISLPSTLVPNLIQVISAIDERYQKQIELYQIALGVG